MGAPYDLSRPYQDTDVIYHDQDSDSYFVSPDGDGRFWYDTLSEAQDQHGDLPVRPCRVDPYEV